jgi:transposase
MQSEEDSLVMHVLHTKHGWSISALAKEFGVNWRTAKRHAISAESHGYSPRRHPTELTEAQIADITRRLAVCPDLRGTTLYRETRDLGYLGSYPSFIRHLNSIRPDSEIEPEIRFETDPGHQVQVDWADCGDWLLGDRLVHLRALVAVLGYSRMVAVRFATDSTRTTTLELLVQLLDELGGAPRQVLSDRDPALVIGQTPGGRAVFAPEWVDLADLLGTVPKACRPYRAQTKGKVERVIRELKQDCLAWVTGQILPQRPGMNDYNRLAGRWITEVVATRRHRTTGRIVAEAWSEEKNLLRPIPSRLLAQPQPIELPAQVFDLTAVRAAGQVVEQPDLADYEAVL